LSISIWRCDLCHCLWLVLEPQVYLKSVISLRNVNIIICTKHRKHWKSYASFQLSEQTRPFLAVLKFLKLKNNKAKVWYFWGSLFHAFMEKQTL
jgi:hypothetical protein